MILHSGVTDSTGVKPLSADGKLSFPAAPVRCRPFLASSLFSPGLLFLHAATGPQCLHETGFQTYWVPVGPSDVSRGYVQAERTGPAASSLLAGGKGVSIL